MVAMAPGAREERGRAVMVVVVVVVVVVLYVV
jgi:hypothetical protein